MEGSLVLCVGPSSAGRKVEKGLSFVNRREAAAETLASTWGLGVDAGQGLGWWAGAAGPGAAVHVPSGFPGSSSRMGPRLRGGPIGEVQKCQV